MLCLVAGQQGGDAGSAGCADGKVVHASVQYALVHQTSHIALLYSHCNKQEFLKIIVDFKFKKLCAVFLIVKNLVNLSCPYIAWYMLALQNWLYEYFVVFWCLTLKLNKKLDPPFYLFIYFRYFHKYNQF